MKILDDVFCGVQHDIPTIKDCLRSLNKDKTKGWKTFQFDFGSNSDPSFLDDEYDEEAEEIIRGCSSNREE